MCTTENQLSTSYIAGIILYDLVQNQNWIDLVFLREPKAAKDLCMELLSVKLNEYAHKNVQAKIVARCLITLYYSNNSKLLTEVFKHISETISEEEGDLIDMPVRTTIYFLEQIEFERIREFHPNVPYILQGILSAFTNEDITSHCREQILHIFYLCLRTISWADGIDNDIITACLDDSFD